MAAQDAWPFTRVVSAKTRDAAHFSRWSLAEFQNFDLTYFFGFEPDMTFAGKKFVAKAVDDPPQCRDGEKKDEQAHWIRLNPVLDGG